MLTRNHRRIVKKNLEYKFWYEILNIFLGIQVTVCSGIQTSLSIDYSM